MTSPFHIVWQIHLPFTALHDLPHTNFATISKKEDILCWCPILGKVEDGHWQIRLWQWLLNALIGKVTDCKTTLQTKPTFRVSLTAPQARENSKVKPQVPEPHNSMEILADIILLKKNSTSGSYHSICKAVKHEQKSLLDPLNRNMSLENIRLRKVKAPWTLDPKSFWSTVARSSWITWNFKTPIISVWETQSSNFCTRDGRWDN